MITEHILFYPHKEYDVKNELTDNLRCSDYVQYGYIKKRDLTKWENNEVISVKMGMLTPSKNGYRGKTILQSAIQRIMEQDSTSCFDDEDELIPVYIFVSKETDNEWREYLKENGFVSSRKNANREGIKINRTNIGLHYGRHYGIETDEVKTDKEKQFLEKEKWFQNKYGKSYDIIKNEQEKRMIELKTQNPSKHYHLQNSNLVIIETTAEKYIKVEYVLSSLFFGIVFVCCLWFLFHDEMLVFNGLFCAILLVINLMLFIGGLVCGITDKEIVYVKNEYFPCEE